MKSPSKNFRGRPLVIIFLRTVEDSDSDSTKVGTVGLKDFEVMKQLAKTGEKMVNFAPAKITT